MLVNNRSTTKNNTKKKREKNMLNFIICDNNHDFAQHMKEIVDKFMMNYDVEYDCILLEGYGKKFKDIVATDKGFKVYLLDIQTSCGSGLDAARYIREEYDDWVSIIVIVTAYNQYRYDAMSNRLYLLDYINKLDNCEKKVKDVLLVSMKHYDQRHKTLSFEYNYVIKKIEYRHIIYVEKQQDSKLCKIQTTYGEHFINKTINELAQILEGEKRFMKVSRSMIVNTDQILSYDQSNGQITFRNGETSFLVSRDYKKELKSRVECSN